MNYKIEKVKKSFSLQAEFLQTGISGLHNKKDRCEKNGLCS